MQVMNVLNKRYWSDMTTSVETYQKMLLKFPFQITSRDVEQQTVPPPVGAASPAGAGTARPILFPWIKWPLHNSFIVLLLRAREKANESKDKVRVRWRGVTTYVDPSPQVLSEIELKERLRDALSEILLNEDERDVSKIFT